MNQALISFLAVRTAGHFVQTSPQREGGLTDLDSALVVKLLQSNKPAWKDSKDSRVVSDALPSSRKISRPV